MSDKKDPDAPWRKTSVVIRSDIWLKAAEMGLDIGDELNMRLAELVGIDYHGLQLTDRPFPDRVYAPDSGTKGVAGRQKSPSHALHPVINADDPASAAKVRKAKREFPPAQIPAVPVFTTPSLPEKDSTVADPVPVTPGRGRTKSPDTKKKRKDEDLKKFIAAKISRTDADDAVISKEEMFQAFTRWCRDHRIAAVLERKVFATLLKNKFAIPEKTVNGTSCWVNVRLG